MATCEVNKIDSNVSGLSIAEEECPKLLPTTPVWYPQEPNTYSDFGATITTVARNPINPTRQRRKGSVTDLVAGGGFQADVTTQNLERLMQGFVFADARQKPDTQPINGTPVVITAVDDTTGYAAAAGLGVFAVNDVVVASGFAVAANNGAKVITTASGTALVAAGLADEASPPAGAALEKVGHQFAAADVAVTATGNIVGLTSAAGAFAGLGLIPGEWIFLGGDNTANRFTNAVGFGRIATVAAGAITFDKVTWPALGAEVGTGKSIRIYYGTIVRNEFDPELIKRRTYQLERTLGQDANGMQAEYITGAVANQLTITLQQANKVTADLTYVGMEYETRDGLTGLKAGTRPSLGNEDMLNTSSDIKHIRLSVVDPTDSYPTPLFAYATDATVVINNNVTPNKALGVLGAMDTSAGTFEVSGSLTAYFADVAAVNAVRNNADVTLDMSLVKNNRGVLIDIPLLTLGNGRLNVVQDQPIMIPLDTTAAQSVLGYTLLFQFFPYLPDVASAE